MLWMNDAEKSSPEKDTSKSLKVSQIPIFALALALLQNKAPNICNLENSSLEKQVDPALVECVRFKVLTWQGLECGDDVSSP